MVNFMVILITVGSKNKLVVQAGAPIDLHINADELALDVAIYSQVKLYLA